MLLWRVLYGKFQICRSKVEEPGCFFFNSLAAEKKEGDDGVMADYAKTEIERERPLLLRQGLEQTGFFFFFTEYGGAWLWTDCDVWQFTGGIGEKCGSVAGKKLRDSQSTETTG